MNRDALGPALIALLAIVALGIGASALDTQMTKGGNSGIGSGDSGIGVGNTDIFSFGKLGPDDLSSGLTIPITVFQLLLAALIVAFVVALYLLRDDSHPRNLGIIVAVLFVFMLIVAAVLKYANVDLGGNSDGSGGVVVNHPLTLPGGGSGSGSTEAFSVTSDPPLLVLAVAAALVIGIVVFFRSQDDDSTPKPDAETEDSETMTELGRVAGRAADRIADDTNADTENEVYRAWQEMTDQLAVSNPQSQTPGEFAHAATDAGMEQEDVTELTDLFRTVRYGGSAPTDERETRAVSALRRIEDEYGGES